MASPVTSAISNHLSVDYVLGPNLSASLAAIGDRPLPCSGFVIRYQKLAVRWVVTESEPGRMNGVGDDLRRSAAIVVIDGEAYVVLFLKDCEPDNIHNTEAFMEKLFACTKEGLLLRLP